MLRGLELHCVEWGLFLMQQDYCKQIISIIFLTYFLYRLSTKEVIKIKPCTNSAFVVVYYIMFLEPSKEF